jgi:hypothetical protein
VVAHLTDQLGTGDSTSPGLIKRCGVRDQPIPDGVPVKIRSPGSNVRMPERYSMMAGIEKIMSSVRDFCINWPDKLQLMATESGLGNSWV